MIFESASPHRKIITILLVLLVVVGIAYLSKPAKRVDQIACTEEAKLCPDGSSVGRSGPRCEFAECPTPPADTTNAWSTFKDPASGVLFRYPASLTTQYISPIDWPPRVAVKTGSFTCTEAGVETERAGKTEKRMVDNRVYCVTAESEGAAGSVYTNYAYATEKNSKVYTFTFSLRAVQCANYDDPEKTECEGERETFDLDGVIDRIVQTL